MACSNKLNRLLTGLCRSGSQKAYDVFEKVLDGHCRTVIKALPSHIQALGCIPEVIRHVMVDVTHLEWAMQCRAWIFCSVLAKAEFDQAAMAIEHFMEPVSALDASIEERSLWCRTWQFFLKTVEPVGGDEGTIKMEFSGRLDAIESMISLVEVHGAGSSGRC